MKLSTLPLVTILLTAALIGLHALYPQPEEQVSEVCLNPKSVWQQGQYSRLLTSFLFHSGWVSAIYNAVMFFNKGYKVENQLFSSGRFLALLLLLGLLSNGIYVLLQVLFMQYGSSLGGGHLQMVKSYNQDCILGANAVLFALNIVSNHLARSGPLGHLFVWAEMFFSSFVILRSPNISHYRSFSIDNSGLCAAYVYLLFFHRFFETKSSTQTPFHLSWLEVGFGFATLLGLYFAVAEHVVDYVPRVEEYAAILILSYLVIALIRNWAEGREVKQNVGRNSQHKEAIIDKLSKASKKVRGHFDCEFYFSARFSLLMEAMFEMQIDEFRRGPEGAGTLCNACGVRYSRSRNILKKNRCISAYGSVFLVAESYSSGNDLVLPQITHVVTFRGVHPSVCTPDMPEFLYPSSDDEWHPDE
ncbi:rhomboid domain-containing protein 1-like [Planoprotostelium fungivorum]|uniref:Rhomboid domain-containing protein 1-like n=1 Tax=Planoprotostelium fungivorum TaxID=1890364 RepID=A0A2P6NBG8_9EUKA|nr:rhomboid domain-containing protein 1-like [Planoprotostelium fungivorum]